MPPVCGSRRCRRGTSNGSVKPPRPGTGAIWRDTLISSIPKLSGPPASRGWRAACIAVEKGFDSFWADVDSGFDERVPDFDEVRDLGDTVVGLGRLRGRSNEGVPIDTQYGVVVRFRDGLAVSGSDWFSHADALEAAGLRE